MLSILSAIFLLNGLFADEYLLSYEGKSKTTGSLCSVEVVKEADNSLYMEVRMNYGFAYAMDVEKAGDKYIASIEADIAPNCDLVMGDSGKKYHYDIVVGPKAFQVTGKYCERKCLPLGISYPACEKIDETCIKD
tara:strand:+ start:8010 stop:8414 length:405 start_codon:yes stop_codon:yes gene_type:complete